MINFISFHLQNQTQGKKLSVTVFTAGNKARVHFTVGNPESKLTKASSD